MLIKREQITSINELIEKLSGKKFDIKIQYKFIKIKKAIKAEYEIYQEQIKINFEPFFERDQNGNPLMNESGGYKIQKEKMSECYLLMNQINSLEIQIPDIYFTFDELETLELTLGELEILEPFIKN